MPAHRLGCVLTNKNCLFKVFGQGLQSRGKVYAVTYRGVGRAIPGAKVAHKGLATGNANTHLKPGKKPGLQALIEFLHGLDHGLRCVHGQVCLIGLLKRGSPKSHKPVTRIPVQCAAVAPDRHGECLQKTACHKGGILQGQASGNGRVVGHIGHERCDFARAWGKRVQP